MIESSIVPGYWSKPKALTEALTVVDAKLVSVNIVDSPHTVDGQDTAHFVIDKEQPCPCCGRGA